jgi:hypothetical protein
MLEKVAHGVLLWTFIQHLFQHIYEIFLGCHSDNGGISVLFDKLSGKDVSFVDMTAWEEIPH